MAIGWFSVLKMVPWGDVLDNAPKVAQGARKLWQAVGKKPAMTSPDAAPQAQASPLVLLQAQLAELQVAAAELHQQMLDSSALIQSLAEQNTQLIKRVALNRLYLLGLTGVVGVLIALLVLQWWR